MKGFYIQGRVHELPTTLPWSIHKLILLGQLPASRYFCYFVYPNQSFDISVNEK